MKKTGKEPGIINSYELASVFLQQTAMKSNNPIFNMHQEYRRTGDENIKKSIKMLTYDILFGKNYYNEIVELEKVE